jgi:hypothetical protein
LSFNALFLYCFDLFYMAAILAEMQSLWAEMNAMRQAGAGAAVGATSIGGDALVGANDEGGGVVQPRGAPQQ